MIDWLLSPIDPSRAHDIGGPMAWHGRIMMLAWGIGVPLGTLFARYFKVTPGQDWPNELDNRFWWHAHLSIQVSAGILTLCGVYLGWLATQSGQSWHAILGWVVVAFALCQYISGWLRGTKGGPTDDTLRGDHYDMTRRRMVFEAFHKGLGYTLLLIAAVTILFGLWEANAPIWMWITLGVFWGVLLLAAILLQKTGRKIDTYQAIWGPDSIHPGNASRSKGVAKS